MPTVYNDDHSDWTPVYDGRAYVMPVKALAEDALTFIPS
jgi:hypothetical protein